MVIPAVEPTDLLSQVRMFICSRSLSDAAREVARLDAQADRHGRGRRKAMKSLRIVGASIAVLCMVSLAAIPLAGAGPITGGQKWALLVGISDYSDTAGYGDLSYCHKDALDMRNLLISNGWMSSHIKVLLNESATQANMVAGIQWLTQNAARGTALFYYSGHGSFFPDKWSVFNNDESNDQCIIPYDANVAQYSNLIFDDQMAQYLSGCKASKTVMILDCCYAAGFIDECGAEGRLIMTAADVHQMSYEGYSKHIPIENGVYTHCMLEAMTGAGDYDGNGVVSLEEAGIYAAIYLQDLTENVRAVVYDGIAGETYL
jgi:hypothetical protein